MAKFISLFAGVGGFDLGMEKAGHECVAQVEWDKNAAGVLKHRWPNVPLFCDVSKVSADDLPDCDFITYGFPCQDVSVAGKREGLEGDRSGLFFEATRLIRELIARGSGLRFAVAENVAGLFSADDGLALARCIGELLESGACETGWALLDSQYFGVAQRRKRVFIVSDFGGESCDEILAISESLPRHPPPSREAGKGTAGDAGSGFAGSSFGGYEQGCGTLRSQGGDLGGGSETLTVKGVFSDGTQTSSSLTTRCHDQFMPDKGNFCAVIQAQGAEGKQWPAEIAGTLDAHYGEKYGLEDQHIFGQHGSRFVPTEVYDMKQRHNPQPTENVSLTTGNCARVQGDTPLVRSKQGGEGPGADVYNGQLTGETAPTLTSATGLPSASGPKVIEQKETVKAIPIHDMATRHAGKRGEKSDGKGNGLGVGQEGDPSPTLTKGDHHAVVSWNGDETPKTSEDVSLTLRSQQGGEGTGVAHGVAAFGNNTQVEVDKMPPLRAGDDRGNTSFMTQNPTVRRLTPKECERLQGFPDNWTSEKMELVLEGNEWKATGKVVKQADGPRYKQMGNAVTVNVAEWIGKQIAKVYE